MRRPRLFRASALLAFMELGFATAFVIPRSRPEYCRQEVTAGWADILLAAVCLTQPAGDAMTRPGAVALPCCAAGRARSVVDRLLNDSLLDSRACPL